jgi:hypothetical protein
LGMGQGKTSEPGRSWEPQNSPRTGTDMNPSPPTSSARHARKPPSGGFRTYGPGRHGTCNFEMMKADSAGEQKG